MLLELPEDVLERLLYYYILIEEDYIVCFTNKYILKVCKAAIKKFLFGDLEKYPIRQQYKFLHHIGGTLFHYNPYSLEEERLKISKLISYLIPNDIDNEFTNTLAVASNKQYYKIKCSSNKVSLKWCIQNPSPVVSYDYVHCIRSIVVHTWAYVCPNGGLGFFRYYAPEKIEYNVPIIYAIKISNGAIFMVFYEDDSILMYTYNSYFKNNKLYGKSITFSGIKVSDISYVTAIDYSWNTLLFIGTKDGRVAMYTFNRTNHINDFPIIGAVNKIISNDSIVKIVPQQLVLKSNYNDDSVIGNVPLQERPLYVLNDMSVYVLDIHGNVYLLQGKSLEPTLVKENIMDIVLVGKDIVYIEEDLTVSTDKECLYYNVLDVAQVGEKRYYIGMDPMWL